MRVAPTAALLAMLLTFAAACGDDDTGDPTTTATTPPATSVAETSGVETTTAEATSVTNDSAAPGPGREIPVAEVDAELERLFAPIAASANGAGGDDEPRISWSLVTTPPLPDRWPPSPDTRWVRWAYAYGNEPQLADAVRVARIWANAWTTPGSETANVIVIFPQLSAFPDPQGFRPLTGEETADRAKLGDAAALAVQLTGEPDAATADLLRRTYGGWVRDNGVILQALPDAHDAFLDWLAEEPVR